MPSHYIQIHLPFCKPQTGGNELASWWMCCEKLLFAVSDTSGKMGSEKKKTTRHQHKPQERSSKMPFRTHLLSPTKITRYHNHQNSSGSNSLSLASNPPWYENMISPNPVTAMSSWTNLSHCWFYIQACEHYITYYIYIPTMSALRIDKWPFVGTHLIFLEPNES